MWYKPHCALINLQKYTIYIHEYIILPSEANEQTIDVLIAQWNNATWNIRDGLHDEEMGFQEWPTCTCKQVVLDFRIIQIDYIFLGLYMIYLNCVHVQDFF